MKILLIADTEDGSDWGVSTTFNQLAQEMKLLGHDPLLITLDRFPRLFCWVFPSVKTIKKAYKSFQPDAVHIFTAGPAGLAARWYLGRKKIPFTASYLIRIDDYGERYYGTWARGLFIRYLRWFYRKASRVIAPSASGKNLLKSMGLPSEIRITPVCIDRDRFVYRKDANLLIHHLRPIFVFRAPLTKLSGALEFCKMDLPGTKVVIGEGKLKDKLTKLYADEVLFYPEDPDIVQEILSEAHVMIAPRTEEIFPTFLLEANHMGTAIASPPVMGAKEYIRNGKNGYMSYDIRNAALKCLDIDPRVCMEMASKYHCQESARNLVSHFVK